MPHVKLTDLAIEKLKPSKAQITFWDTALPIGFGIRIGARRKTFILIDTSGKRIKLGLYPHTTLAEARAKALEARHGPKTDQAPPISKCVSDYIAKHTGSARWIKEQERLLNRHLLSRHASTPASRITTADILSITDALKKTPSEQLHAHRGIKALFHWLLARKLVQSSPLDGLPAPGKETKRDRVLSYDELKQIWTASEALSQYGVVVKLCILTGQRIGEVSTLKSSYVSNKAIIFPSQIMKSRKEHMLPLTDRSDKLMTHVPFTIRPSGKLKQKLDELSNVNDWTIHDLRRTFATNLAELAVEPHIIERLLNHSTGTISGVGAIYNRFHFLPQMKEALERYENELVKRGIIP